MADKDKNSSAFLSYRGCLVFKLFCSFYYALDISSPKMKSLQLEVNIFQNSAKIEVKTFWPTKIEKRSLLYLILLATQASNFYTTIWTYSFRNKDAKLAVSIF